MITIRASSTTNWLDCQLRAAAHSAPALFTEHGWELAPPRSNIGALVGSGVHGAAEPALTERMLSGTVMPVDAIEDAGIEAFRARRSEEAETEVAALAGWQPARIGDDFAIRMGDDLYEDHSRSRQWRIRLMLQVAFAKIDGSSAVIVDELDLLDVPSRPAAMKLLLGCGLPAVVAMTTTPAKAIDLGAKGLGQTVIIEGGEGRALEAERKEAA